MSESTRNKIRYNIVPLDEDKIKSDSYKLRSYTSASENNPRDQFYRYEANRNDTNLFVSGTYNETRTQIQDAVYTEFKKGDINVVNFNSSKNSLSIVEGNNSAEQKVYGYVFEKIKANPTQTITFTEQQSMDLVSKTGMFIRNIKIYGSSIGVKNSYMPATVIAPSDFQGYRAQLSSSGVTTAYDITKIHHEGDIKTSLQGPFTNQHVGGYAHRHQAINVGSDNSSNRLEMTSISASGNTINFISPVLPVKFSREGGAKRFVNTRRIKTVDPRIAGNYSKNYEVFQATDRNENNLWLRSHPTASFALIDSPYISGTKDYQVQDFKLGDGTNTKTIIVQKFGAPGGPETNAASFLDSTSRQFSPYNSVNYRNPVVRYYLNNKFLVNHAEFGNYTTAGYGLTASFQGVQRNPSYYTGSSGIYKKYDNVFVGREIPASPRGYSWIKTRFGTGSFDNNVFVKDYNNPGITFLSKSLDQKIYFENLSLASTQDQIVKSSSFSAYSQSFNATNSNSLNVYLTAKNKLLGFGTQRQLSNYYNPIRIYTRKNNYVGDTDDKKKFVYFKHPPINSKYENIVVQYEMEDGSKEDISLPFASNYAYLGDFYNTASLKIDSLYRDNRNIKFIDKKDSLFFKILDNDNERRKNQINYPKINKINYTEKVWPKVEHSYTIRSMARDTIPLFGNYWNNNDSVRINQSPGRNGSGPTNASINDYYNNVNTSSTGKLWQSYWPLDVYTTSSGNIFIDQSGVLMTLDNPTFVSANYPGVGFPNHLPSASYRYTEFGKFGRNFNINRPKNTVQLTANSFPYYQDYQQISYDIRNNFKGYGTLACYSPFLMLTSYYNEAATLEDNYEYNSSYNQILNLTGDLDLISEPFSLDPVTGEPATNTEFYEKYNYSDFIDVLPDFNQNEDLKISKLKINLNAVKKFFAFANFYASDFSVYTLARNFYLYYIGTRNKYSNAFELSSSLGILSTVEDGTAWAKPAIAPFTSPGILYNSIKAGIAMPYSVITSSVSASVLVSSLTGNYYKAPWETILDPSKIATIKMYDNDPDIQTPISASATLQKGFQKDSAYKSLANNFFSEVVDFFLKDGILPRLKSKPQDSWYFPDITKDYSMKFVINKTNKFTTYSSLESFGPKPYIFHNPPWMTAGADANITTVNNPNFNSDVNLAPSASYNSASYALATITFKPSLITSSAGVQIVAGKGSQFTFNEIKRYSTVTFENSFVTSSQIAQQAVNLGDCVELFGFSEDDKTWTPYVKWTCPTANLNFSGTVGKLSASSNYDNGGVQAGDAVRGIWHQLGILPDESTGLFLQALDNSNAATGSLLNIVGFNPKDRVRVGEVANNKSYEEAIVIIPVYLENSIEEKLLYFNLDKFEKNYETEQYIKDIDLLSKNYVLPPLLDYMRVRRESKIPLSKRNYGNVAAPFLMFFSEFKTILSKDDLLKIWQGITPAGSNTMEIDNKVIEFDLKNSNLFSYDDLVMFGNTLPKNLRFKVFKVFRRAETNYQNIVNKTLGIPIKQNYKLTTNWPYSHGELINMAEVKVELEYDKTFGVPKGSHVDSKGNVIKDTETKQ